MRVSTSYHGHKVKCLYRVFIYLGLGIKLEVAQSKSLRVNARGVTTDTLVRIPLGGAQLPQRHPGLASVGRHCE